MGWLAEYSTSPSSLFAAGKMSSLVCRSLLVVMLRVICEKSEYFIFRVSVRPSNLSFSILLAS